MAEIFVSFSELKQSIWDGFLEDPGNCERANQAAHLAEVFLPRSPDQPKDGMQEVVKFVGEIVTRHKQFCPGSDNLSHWLLDNNQAND